MSEDSLPDLWAVVPIEDCLLPYPNGKRIRQGWSPQCEKFPAQTVEDWGVLKTSAIQDGFFLEEKNKHLPAKLEPRTHLEVEAGDILITCAGPRSRCGVTCLVRSTRPKLLISGKMYQLRADSEIVDRQLLELFLREPRTKQRIDELKTGINDSGLNLTHDRFKTLEIPLPPLAEQQRIVAKIEELFSELDAGEESLRRARRQLGVYRQSLLKQAFEGKLTAPWRAQLPDLLESPDQLLARIQAERQQRYQQQLKEWEKAGGTGKKPSLFKFDDAASIEAEKLPATPDGWHWRRLDQIAEIGTSMSVSKSRTFSDPIEVPYLRVANVQRGSLDLSEMKTMRIEREKLDDLKLKPGDVLFNEGGDRDKLGRGWVWPGAPDPCITQNHVFRATLVSETVALPPAAEQLEILGLLDAQFEVIEQNEREIDAALKRSEALRQSILKKAFSGQLVPQDPADEPASVLLERIRAERAAPSAIVRRSPAKRTL